MKIIFSSISSEWSSSLDSHFGRAKGFFVFNSETKDHFWIDNGVNVEAAHGAGIQAAQRVIQEDPDVIITGSLGPKAKDVLSRTGIEVYQAEENSISEVYKAFTDGKLNKIETNNY